LVAPLGQVASALVVREFQARACLMGAVFDLRPESAGADRLALAWVADRDDAGAGGLDRAQQSDLFAGGRERGLVVNYGSLRRAQITGCRAKRLLGRRLLRPG
jgi:hypothetical protein